MMKKHWGWLLIGFSIIALLGLDSSYQYLENHFHSLFSNIDKTNLKLFIPLGIGLSLFVYIKGIHWIKTDIPYTTIPYNQQLNIQFSGLITYEEYKQITREVYMEKKIWIYIVIAPFLLVYFFFPSFDYNQNFNTNYLLLFLLFILVPVYFIYSESKRVKKRYHTTIEIQKCINYHITNESIHISSDLSNSIHQWKIFSKIKETKRFYLLYTINKSITFIPKSLMSPEDISQFNQFILSLPLIKEPLSKA